MDKIGKADNFCVYFSLGWIQISSEVFPTVRKPNVINYDVVFVSTYLVKEYFKKLKKIYVRFDLVFNICLP